MVLSFNAVENSVCNPVIPPASMPCTTFSFVCFYQPAFLLDGPDMGRDNKVLFSRQCSVSMRVAGLIMRTRREIDSLW